MTSRQHHEPPPQEWIEDPDGNGPLLPWVRPWRRRCKARLNPRPPDRMFWGRCELARGHHGILHALERGMHVVRFDDHGREVTP